MLSEKRKRGGKRSLLRRGRKGCETHAQKTSPLIAKSTWCDIRQGGLEKGRNSIRKKENKSSYRVNKDVGFDKEKGKEKSFLSRKKKGEGKMFRSALNLVKCCRSRKRGKGGGVFI